MEGLNTCLVVHSQDKTAEELMGCKIGNSPTECKNNLSIVRLETSKVTLLFVWIFVFIHVSKFKNNYNYYYYY